MCRRFRKALCLLTITIVIGYAFGQDAECSGVEDTERADCGVLGTEEEGCVAMNCCWEEQPEGTATPWCYYRPSDPCLSSPCVYGTCTSDVEGGYECDCFFGYLGENCDELDDSICPPADREMCTGEVEVCSELGCCFDPEANLCYMWAGGPRGPPGAECAADVAERDNCAAAEESTRMEECIELGCCWEPVSATNAPWCYEASGVSMTTEPPVTEPPLPVCDMEDTSRVECGFSGITQETCVGVDFDCCWAEPNDTNPGAGHPWCFEKLIVNSTSADVNIW